MTISQAKSNKSPTGSRYKGFRKKKLHEDIGNAIEELYKENITEFYGVLAEHFIQSENYEKGAEYCRLTARKDRKAASINEAILYTIKRIACIEKLPQTENIQKQLIDAKTNLGLFYTETNSYSKIKDVVEPIVELALKLGYKKRLSQINTIIGSYCLFSEMDHQKAFFLYILDLMN